MSRTSHDQALLYNSKYKDKFREKLAALHERYVSDKQTVDDDKRLYEDYLRKFADYPIVVLDSGDWNRLNNVYHLNLHDYFAAVCIVIGVNLWVKDRADDHPNLFALVIAMVVLRLVLWSIGSRLRKKELAAAAASQT